MWQVIVDLKRAIILKRKEFYESHDYNIIRRKRNQYVYLQIFCYLKKNVGNLKACFCCKFNNYKIKIIKKKKKQKPKQKQVKKKYKKRTNKKYKKQPTFCFCNCQVSHTIYTSSKKMPIRFKSLLFILICEKNGYLFQKIVYFWLRFAKPEITYIQPYNTQRKYHERDRSTATLFKIRLHL